MQKEKKPAKKRAEITAQPNIELTGKIAPAFKEADTAIKAKKHSHYWLKGGRGSCKSSFVALEIIAGIMENPGTNALVLRKVKDTLKDSVYHQLEWAIDELGVTEDWRSTTVPMEMKYKTGQTIIFRGLDYPQKLKSLKMATGYIRYCWMEEASELSGLADIRNVLQSVMRGGPKYDIFYTYNPPRSQRHWINRMTNLDLPPDSYTHQSDYRTVPKEWLGERFFIEAEHLAEVRPELYRQEYLGEVTGTGTEVFQNLTLREITESEIRLFDRIYRGMDFGFATDPAQYVVCHYDSTRKRLYLFDEARLYRASSSQLGEAIRDEMKRHGRGAVMCDSADPKTIRDLYQLGIPAYGAAKGPGSVGWGMRFLTNEVEEIIIDPVRCPESAREFYEYEFPMDAEGRAIAEYPDQRNHSIDATRYAMFPYMYMGQKK